MILTQSSEQSFGSVLYNYAPSCMNMQSCVLYEWLKYNALASVSKFRYGKKMSKTIRNFVGVKS
ncbi:MAG: hypothetical protein RR137_05230 [Odoribacter sp.]